MMHAIVQPGRDQLHGNIEVNETLIGGENYREKRVRGTNRKAIVIIALEIL